MIVSASFRTDIPAFYGEWFMNRLRAGFCEVLNPYGGGNYRVVLSPDATDGFVFWTKNLGPFLEHLPEIQERGFPFTVQYTINNFPRALEYSVLEAERSIAHVHRLAHEFGGRVAVWRYDPILASSLTPLAWHRRNFEELARQLAGATDEVVVSFVHLYRKTRRNLASAARASSLEWEDPSAPEKRKLTADLAGIARGFGMRLSVCSQSALLAGSAKPARCIDAARLSDVARRPIPARLKGNRPDCECHESRDIGAYDTCPHGCIYCYAVQHRGLARRRYKRHDPRGERLGCARDRDLELGVAQASGRGES
jgi:DNA repair photolyase